jgi:hypothetical protein
MTKRSLTKVLKTTKASQPKDISGLFDYYDEELFPEDKVKKRQEYFCQYNIEQGSNFRPSSKTIDILPAGLYKAQEDQYGTFFSKEHLDMSELIRVPDSIANTVIDEFDTFWKMKDRYLDRGEPHKRGFLLWGPPGSGKTCTVSFIIKDFIAQGNIVFVFNYQLMGALSGFKSIEPNRKVLIVMEDIDSLIKDRHEEQAVLEFLDGSIQHSNTIVIATTNYPEDLPDRIINRPSRFDRVSYVGVPSLQDRILYLTKKSKSLSKPQIKGWAKETENWTLAHLKELILAVEIFGLEYDETDETVKRINIMRAKKEHSVQYEPEFRGSENVGF